MPRRSNRNTTQSKTGGCLVTVIFGGVFSVAGTTMFIFFTVLPLWRIYQAQSWTATPCTITRSQVETHTGSDNDTYSIDIRYRYTFNGQPYTGDTYRFAPPGSSSGYKGKKRVVDAHPVGSTQTCYVDPNAPRRSVIHRGLTAALWWGLFPLPFMAVGYGVLFAGFTGKLEVGTRGNRSSWRPKRTARASRDTLPPSADSTDPGPVTLRPGKSRLGNLAGLIFFATFWNGIVSVFVTQLVRGYLKGDPDACLTVFLIPFVLIGLFLIGAAVRQFLILFAPTVAIELGRRSIPLGGSTDLRWRVLGRSDSIKRIRITLLGKEKATYRRGTDTTTDTHTFYEKDLDGSGGDNDRAFDTLPLVRESGDCVLAIPTDTMHSFNADNNKIVWKLVVRAEIARWPDPKDEYTITVLPMPVGETR